MKYVFLPAFILLGIFNCFSQRKNATIFYDFGNGGGLTLSKTQYDSLNSIRFNEKDSSVIQSMQLDMLHEMYYSKRGKIFKEMSNMPLPDFEAKDVDKYHHNTAQYRGRVLILHFWMFESNNLNFKQTIPELNRLVNRYQKDGLAVLSLTNVALGEYEKEVVKENPLNFPLIENAYQFTNEFFKMRLMRPCFIVVDKMGNMRYLLDKNLFEKALNTKTSHGISEFEQQIIDLLK